MSRRQESLPRASHKKNGKTAGKFAARRQIFALAAQLFLCDLRMNAIKRQSKTPGCAESAKEKSKNLLPFSAKHSIIKLS
jgi:hypothetical protein